MKNPKLNKLKKMRNEKGLTTTQVAKYLGISQSMCSYIENGDKRLSYDIAVKLGELFETTPDEIFYEDFEIFFASCI